MEQRPLNSPNNRRGFSLVELSIVLVILGLLVGGILSGQALIRAAELRSVVTEYNRYVTATQSFRDKYFALPGDMTNAQSFWGVAHATPATCVTTPSTTPATCNGDGNGTIDYASAGSNETYRFWQHLANSGLIEGSYSGVSGSGNNYTSTTTNSPIGKLNSALWFAWNYSVSSGNPAYFDGAYGNTLRFGGAITNSHPWSNIFRPDELWNIDSKMDDGKPALGKVVVGNFAAGISGCTTTIANNSATLTADYLLTGTSLACIVFFRQAF